MQVAAALEAAASAAAASPAVASAAAVAAVGSSFTNGFNSCKLKSHTKAIDPRDEDGFYPSSSFLYFPFYEISTKMYIFSDFYFNVWQNVGQTNHALIT